jgi:hypothetical protein
VSGFRAEYVAGCLPDDGSGLAFSALFALPVK